MAASLPSPDLPLPVTGTLKLYQTDPISLPYLDTNPDLPNSFVFIPGLTDTLGSVPYLALLAETLHKHNFSLVQPQIASNLGGYGLCTLEGDAQEIAACIAHLRTTEPKRKGRVVLMGHSTGCQDSIAYLLSSARAVHPATRIDGAILQAPVSDREDYEHRRSRVPEQERKEWDEKLAYATKLVKEGKGGQLMPRDNPSEFLPPTKPIDEEVDPSSASGSVNLSSDKPKQDGNSRAVLSTAMTAYRYWSLYAKGGDDDFFSSDLSDRSITDANPGIRSIGRAIKNLQTGAVAASATVNKPQILALMGEKDEFIQPEIGRALVERWEHLLGPTGGFEAILVEGANHKVDDREAQTSLVQLVEKLLIKLG